MTLTFSSRMLTRDKGDSCPYFRGRSDALFPTVVTGSGSFTTTSTEDSITVSPLDSVHSVICTPQTKGNANDRLSCDPKVTGSTLTVRRAASGTSGLVYSFIAVGQIST